MKRFCNVQTSSGYAIFVLCYLAFSKAQDSKFEYGADVSFPVHQQQDFWSAKQNTPLGEGRQLFYRHFIEGCRTHYGKQAERCDSSERDRIAMNLQQPSVMENYTSAGYAKVELPISLTLLLKKFHDDNSHRQQKERWSVGSTFVNHWHVDTGILSIEDPNLQGGGRDIKKKIVEFTRETLEAWTGQHLVFTSLYGVRIYNEGAVLASHVDRLPLVSSAIINVAQDVDEPWPLELIGHDGLAHNLTLAPGEMVLYESHSIIHGRPFPLKGSYYANVFVHFEPVGHTQRHGERMHHGSRSVDDLFLEALEHTSGTEAEIAVLPEYIRPGSKEEVMWKQLYAFQLPREKSKDLLGSSNNSKRVKKADAHKAAALGDLHRLKQLAKEKPDALLESDHNGWRPLHEAARAGQAATVEYLINQGAKVNERTNKGKGGTSLWWAKQYFDDNHAVIQALQRNGAIDHAPEIDVIV